MSKFKFNVSMITVAILLCFATSLNVTAQAVSGYTFVASSGTFTPLAGATTLTLQAGTTDDGRYNPAPIGFTFRYLGVDYTQTAACTNGWMSFPTASNFARGNDLAGTLALPGGSATRPFVAPFFDDHEMDAGSVSYLTTGAAPNRVFTMQWLNVKWDYLGAAPAISFQVKLYETTNRVQFIYRQEAGAIGSDPGTFGASIGLAGTATGSGQYLALSNSGASPTISSSANTVNIATKPANGQTYTFTPGSTASNVSVSGRVRTIDGRGLSNTIVTITDSQGGTRTARTSSFGYFRFDDVASGQTYIVSINSKSFQFASQAVSVVDQISDLDLVVQ